MTRVITLSLLLLSIAACAAPSATVVTTRMSIPTLSPSLFECPTVVYPDETRLTDRQVATLLLEQAEALSICRTNMRAIRRVLTEAGALTSTTNQ